jgi:flagellar biosynthetic protein FlhB
MFGDKAQRTERPTPKRLQKARREGNVPRTRDLPAALSLGAFLLFCHFGGGAWLRRAEEFLATGLSQLTLPDLDAASTVRLLSGTASATALLLIAPLGVMLAGGVAGNLLQGVPSFTLDPLRPNFSRLNPVKGLAKLFRLKSLVELLKTALKLLLFTAIAVSAVRDAWRSGVVGGPSPEGALAAIVATSGTVIFRVTLLALGLALLDLLYTRFDHLRQLRMTKQEIKDERREQEGDPLVRARVRSRQMSLARSRMMADVPKATVVVTNPTRFAVALRYVPGEIDVPRVLAKGRGRIAERIREIAAEHGVPIISDPPLARALFRSVPVGGFIPAQLFRAVAEILALVLKREPRARVRPTAPEERP